MVNRYRFSRSYVLLSCAASMLAGCSAADPPGSTAQPHDAESVGDVPVAELAAKILSATNSGELCPTVPWDDNHDGLPDNMLISLTNDVLSAGLGPVAYECGTPEAEAAAAAASKGLSANPSCTITLDLEVPAGTRIGVPNIIWHGFASSPGEAVVGSRSYSFENGESVVTGSVALNDNFRIMDRALAAYSPTCAGPQHARLTATFQAQVPSPVSQLQLDSVDFLTSFRLGAEFKQGCSSDELLTAPAGQSREWCGGYHQRACASGLQCDFDEGSFVEGQSSGAEGTCVDPTSVGKVAAVGAPCDGLTHVQCESGAVCWHKPGAPANWLGSCVHERAEVREPCRTGSPSLECAAPLICMEESHSCVALSGEVGDACGPDLPECVKPLFCAASKACAQPDGSPGDPCGDPELPECKSPAHCENNVCVDSRNKLGEGCGEGTPGCAGALACINGVCAPAPAKLCVKKHKNNLITDE